MRLLTFRISVRADPFVVDCDRLKRIGTGGVAKVYEHRVDSSQAYALKIYDNPSAVDWSRIEALIEFGEARSKDELASGTVAWPLGVILEGSIKVGVVLSLYPKDQHLSLDDWIEVAAAKKLPADLDSLPTRLRIAANLSDLVSYAHRNGVKIVDLKPSNIYAGRFDLCVTILDADSFGFSNSKGNNFKPTHVSANYIDPKSYGPNMDIGELGEEQDLYALAVIVFQILNFGIHPFQSVLRHEVPGAGTNDEKAKLGLYAYGLRSNSVALPLKISVHQTWPKKIRDLFDASFSSNRVRTSATEWRDVLSGVLEGKEMIRCEAFPADPRHIHFAGAPCARCLLTERRASNVAQPSRVKDDFSRPQQQLASPPAIPPTRPKPWRLLGFGVVVIAFVWFVNAKNNSGTPSNQSLNYSSTNSSNMINTPANPFWGAPSFTICESALTENGGYWSVTGLGSQATLVAQSLSYSLDFCRAEMRRVPNRSDSRRPYSSYSEYNLCRSALNDRRDSWEAAPTRVEAQFRNLTISDCLRILGVSTVAQPPTSSASPVRTYLNTGEAELRLTQANWRRIQTALSAATNISLVQDGVVGPNTRSAIAHFQRASGLDATGEINDATLRKLRTVQSARLGYQPDLGHPEFAEVVRSSNGDQYRGEMSGGKRNGAGTYIFQDGAKYEGQFREGDFDGLGRLSTTTGYIFEGQWILGKRSGYGVATYPNRGRYEGNWRNNRPNGHGTYFGQNGYNHSGTWIEGCLRDQNYRVLAFVDPLDETCRLSDR